MGQYQQWLRYQEIDQSLRKTREALEKELTQIEGQLDLVCLEQLAYEPKVPPVVQAAQQVQSPHSLSSNLIIAIFLAHLSSEPEEQASQEFIEPASYASNGQDVVSPPEEMSPMLTGWQEYEDMSVYFDEHTMTDPQLELPWWLRKITGQPAGVEHENGSEIDPGSVRTNKLVQRWIDRWGKQSPSDFPATEQDEGRSHAT